MTLVGLRAAIADAAQTLAAAGAPSPRVDAELLACHLLRCRRADLLVRDTVDAEAYAALVNRRAAREPLQHITGEAHFRHLTLAVGPGVFVPRPETEVVAGWAVAALRASGVSNPLVVDLCTGSGAIALALATEVPGARVHALERDEPSLVWARRNLAGTGVALHHAEVADGLGELDGTVDLVVSNPPYLPAARGSRPAPEADWHDPGDALWGGPDGLDVIRLVAVAGWRLLRPGGLLVTEHDDAHSQSAPDLLRRAGWADVADHEDLAGRPRFVTAVRP